ncbi:MAG: bifunctional riboflavin kinase/FAD synthetase [Oligoflexia bacterium]|nr:bifunctional riboflavin kinase/FAD synthetase [Oligoflexia bacterium]
MKIVDNIDKIINELGSNDQIGITIGNFDGVHLGHKKLLSEVYEECLKLNLKFILITFVPHPKMILVPNLDKNYLINTYIERRELLQELKVIDFLVEMNFTRDFSLLSPFDFIQKKLLENQNIGTILKKLFLGHDFSFGANKSGDISFIREKFPNLDVKEHKMFTKNSAISSTIIRNLIKSGDIKEAEELLGRKYFISGIVMKSKGLGRKIGFPTANLDYSEFVVIPKRGVYLTSTEINGFLYRSVTNVGFNPTTDKEDKDVNGEVSNKTNHIFKLETYILDYNSNIYGDRIKVYFEKRIRDEITFSSIEELKKQIEDDVTFARNFINSDHT